MEDNEKQVLAEEELYTRVSRRFFLELQEGTLTRDEFLVLVSLMFRANPYNGIATTSYGAVVDELSFSGKGAKNKVTKIMGSLKKKRCIWFPNQQGCHKGIRLAIENYFLIGDKVKRVEPYFVEESRIRKTESGAKLRKSLTELLTKCEGTHEVMDIYKKKSGDEIEIEKLSSNTTTPDDESRSVKNESDSKTKIYEINSTDSLMSMAAKGLFNLEQYPNVGKAVIEFQPKNDIEIKCRDIALLLGERDMRYILKKLRQLRGDISKIEEAYEVTQSAFYSMPEDKRENFEAGPYFNKVLERKVNETNAEPLPVITLRQPAGR